MVSYRREVICCFVGCYSTVSARSFGLFPFFLPPSTDPSIFPRYRGKYDHTSRLDFSVSVRCSRSLSSAGVATSEPGVPWIVGVKNIALSVFSTPRLLGRGQCLSSYFNDNNYSNWVTPFDRRSPPDSAARCL